MNGAVNRHYRSLQRPGAKYSNRVDETIDRQSARQRIRIGDEFPVDAARVQRVAPVDDDTVENAVPPKSLRNR